MISICGLSWFGVCERLFERASNSGMIDIIPAVTDYSVIVGECG